MLALLLVGLLSTTDPYAELLVRTVHQDGVDYNALRAERTALDNYVRSLAAKVEAPSLAQCINAYNALVLQALLDSGPKLPQKITDIQGFFDQRKHAVFGRQWTLNELETHARVVHKDPRLHFAFNCGAKSCPPLLNQLYQERELSTQLDTQTRAFLDGPGLEAQRALRRLSVSKLFEWYAADFGPDPAARTQWVLGFVREPSRVQALREGWTWVIRDYDWRPNERPAPKPSPR